jgi:hypothetical protein
LLQALSDPKGLIAPYLTQLDFLAYDFYNGESKPTGGGSGLKSQPEYSLPALETRLCYGHIRSHN